MELGFSSAGELRRNAMIFLALSLFPVGVFFVVKGNKFVSFLSFVNFFCLYGWSLSNYSFFLSGYVGLAMLYACFLSALFSCFFKWFFIVIGF